ncbi:MAG: peptide/nickel transport system permease protein [Gammaproteobacteria bacterium]|jgi:peptide/nickel transport system permease protein
MSSFVQRLITAAIVLLGVSSITFFLLHLVPGDPIEVMLGESANLADRARLRTELGLDAPLFQQWTEFHAGLLRLDFGNSLFSKKPIADMLATSIPWTVLLAAVSLACALIIAVPLGVLAALRPNTGWDTTAATISLLGVSIPNFLLGPLLIIVFSIGLGWLPVGGNDGLESIVLPALTLGASLAAILARMVRASLLEVLSEEYIVSARARGLARSTVVLRHALPNAALPVLTIIGLQLGALLGGAVITETIFSWPGLGQMTIEAIQRRDYPLVQACVLTISASYVLVNTVTDLVYVRVDPRIN